jgi:hypothetical protein
MEWDYSNHCLPALQMDAMVIHATMAVMGIIMINEVTPQDIRHRVKKRSWYLARTASRS